jgi:predicted metal-binding transcription factor (methanogenesis marker protein 9)
LGAKSGFGRVDRLNRNIDLCHGTGVWCTRVCEAKKRER